MKSGNHNIFLLCAGLVMQVLYSVPTDALAQHSRDHIRKSEAETFSMNTDNALKRFVSTLDKNYDVLYYELGLSVFPEAQNITGSVTMTALAGMEDFQEVRLDLLANMTVDSVLTDERKLVGIHSGDELLVYLDEPLQMNDMFSVSIFYHGHPLDVGGFASFRFDSHAGVPIISTLSEPFGAPAWWPCKDDPADKADSVDINVTVPEPYIVASNGSLVDVMNNQNGTFTYKWEERYPISTYLVSLAMTNYRIFSDYYRYSDTDSMEVRYYVYPEHFEAAKTDFAITVDMIAFFSSVFSQYPFLNEKYAMAEFPWRGAMEHQTCTSYGSNFITGDNRYDYINAHEIAHQWFGDLVTIRDWSHIWLNEGFASYAEALWFEHLHGSSGLLEYMRSMDRGFFPASVFVPDSTNRSALFSYTVYDKGAWVLHMLRYVMGDSAFFKAISQYVQEYAYKNANTANFQLICENNHGSSLMWFFEQWIYGYYRPQYTYSWDYVDESMKSIALSIDQTQTNSTLFKMPLDIGLMTESGDTTIVVWDSLASQSFTLKAGAKINDLTIDPDGWVLKSLRLKNISKPMTLFQNFPNPFKKTTKILFDLPYKGDITLTVYNVLGQKIKCLFDGIGFNQLHEIVWDGTDSRGQQVASGVYYYELEFDNQYAERNKMTLLR